MRRGFTLIELLVVIAIIAILAAILFPVFLNAKQRAVQQQCLGNLRQLATAMNLYAGDNGGRLPNARVCMSWPSWEGARSVGDQVFPEEGQIFPYVNNKAIYLCPSDRGRVAEQFRGTSLEKNYALSYSMNFRLSWQLIGNFRRPKKVLLLVHESRRTINDGDFNWWATLDDQSEVHYDGTTVAYVDGHAAWKNHRKLQAARDGDDWEPFPQ